MTELSAFRRKRIRLISQTELAECGIACLAMIANFYGHDIDLGTMRRRFPPSMRGATLRSLMDIADSIGLIPRAVKLRLEAISKLQLPAILHWGMNHFVVLERFRAGSGLVHDPSGTSFWATHSVIASSFTGVALELQPSAGFSPSQQRDTLQMRMLWSRLKGIKRTLLQVGTLSLTLEAFLLVSPYFLQISVDSALPSHDLGLLTNVAAGFVLLNILNACAIFLRSSILLIAGTSIGFGVAVNIARRLLRLPIQWFERRSVGDVLSRFQSVIPIQRALTEGAAAALIDGFLSLITLLLMIIYSPILALVSCIAVSVYLGSRLITLARQRRFQEASMIARGKEQSTLIETIRAMPTLRISGNETNRHAVWQTRLVEASNADIRASSLNTWQSTFNALIFGIENVVLVWLAIREMISEAGITLGMLFAFLAYRNQFVLKASSLADRLLDLRLVKLHLERLSDIALAEEDPCFRQPLGRVGALVGRVELRDICYSYGQNDPLVLNGVNLDIEPGDHIAITGTSGGGKSTLVNIILALSEPISGVILIDGIPIQSYGVRNYHRQISAVLQEDCLFAGSLADNIALFSEHADMRAIEDCARSASIHDDILQMPMQYETLVGDMGSSLSGGQKQRVLLARALYRKPRILVIDEGTSHLDPVHEAKVSRSIDALGITRIIVAHRKETIDAARRVFVLEGGRIRVVR